MSIWQGKRFGLPINRRPDRDWDTEGKGTRRQECRDKDTGGKDKEPLLWRAKGEGKR
jgi:hypothetical protein